MLDADEYLHLAINSSQAGDHQAALEHLHKALEKDSAHIGARYFLAAEHAELGLYERAYVELQELLAVEPEVAVARFQLGLLSLQLDRKDSAQQAFNVLAAEAADESLQLFAKAYLCLLAECQDDAIELFSKGLPLCGNVALRADMNRVLVDLKSGVITEADEPDATVPPVFLGAYRNSDEAS